MKENIEEDIIRIENILNNEKNFKKNRRGNKEIRFEVNSNTYNKLKFYLSDYKRVLKENEELLREKIDNKKIIALAQNEFLDYEQGYQDGKAGRGSATQDIIEGQQYYIIQEQIEKYKNQIEKLQKENEEWQRAYQEEKDKQFEVLRENQKLQEENEELKHKYDKALSDVIAGVDLDNTYIPKQKIKDKIEELNKKEKQELKGTKGQDRYSIKQQHMYQRNILQDLLEEKGE